MIQVQQTNKPLRVTKILELQKEKTHLIEMNPFLLSKSLVKVLIYPLIQGHYLCQNIDPHLIKLLLHFLSHTRKG